jgi:putative FmdB family regulatory protein
MPTYDYRCTECGHEIEVRHGIDAPGPAVCTVCGGTMRKALSTPAIHFKGSGWAKKDAQAASKAKASKPSTEAKPGSAADGEPTGDGGKKSAPDADGAKGEGAKGAATKEAKPAVSQSSTSD